MDNTEYEIFSYNDLIFPLNMEPSDMTDFQLSWWNNSAFLKMILLPVAGRGGNAARDIEIRFREKLDKALKYWKKVNVIGDKDFEGWEEEQKQEFWLHAMVECDFCFSTPYFDIFRYIYDNQELFVSKKGNHMDAALSILHLNAFTKWYDALLLMENMPLSFRNFQFFYLKMLSIYPEFQDVVEAASNISKDFFEKKLDQTEQNISFADIQNLFYEKSSIKLSRDELLHIFKTDKVDASAEVYTSRINPVFKWILLLDGNCKITEEELEEFDNDNERFIVYSTYRDHVSVSRDSADVKGLAISKYQFSGISAQAIKFFYTLS